MKIDFSGKTVIVSGGGHGLGRAIAHGFAARGAVAWVCDVNGAGLRTTAAEAKPAEGGAVVVRTVNVADRAVVGNFVEDTLAARGRVDVLINNAGGVCGQVGQPIEAVRTGQWQEIFDVNVTGAFNLSQAVAPAMKAVLAGRIVNISSVAGLGVSLTGIQAYAAAKSALIGLTRQLAHELGPFGITVNSVAPGFVRSNPTTERQWESYGPEGQRSLVESIAMRRLGTPDDIANAVLFFASEYAGWITGQVLAVSGGR